MSPLDGRLVVAVISSRALFDFEARNRVFEQGDDRACMQLPLQRLDVPAASGVSVAAAFVIHRTLRVPRGYGWVTYFLAITKSSTVVVPS